MINVQNNNDNKCFKWFLFRYSHPADHHHPARITKADEDFSKRLDFKDIKFPIKTRGIHKIEESNYISISVCRYENKNTYLNLNLGSKKFCEEKVLIYYW